MKSPVLAILAIILAGIVLFGVGDTALSTADTSVPDNEVTGSEANNASASASITITMCAVAEGHPGWRRF